MISTSINISASRKERLVSASIILGVPVGEVLSALMARSRIHYDQFAATLWRAVEYQPDSIIEGEEYLIMHVRLDTICYEYGVSERLVFKVSVSFIYRVAIDLFLDDLVKYGLKTPVCDIDLCTNYPYLDYNVTYTDSATHEFWTIGWQKRVKRRKTYCRNTNNHKTKIGKLK